jgi:sigma-B regulation protein RsbU (phosphoserine phosphatase)
MPGLLDYLSDKYQTENVREINQRLIELSSVFETSQILNSTIELEAVLNNLLLIPMGRLMISRGIVFLKSQDKFIIKFAKGISKEPTEFYFEVNELPVENEILDLESLSGEKFPKICSLMEDQRLALFIPVYSQDHLIGVLLYGKKIDNNPFTNEEKDFLSSLANLSATAIENAMKLEEIKDINQQLDERIQQLKTLFDIAQGLSATLESEKIIKLLVYALMGQMLVYHYAIIIYSQAGLQKLESKGFSEDTLEVITKEHPDMADFELTMLVNEIQNVKLKQKLQKIKAQVFIPMRHQNKFLGFILLGEKINKQEYSSADLEFLSTIVSQAIISLENARLFKETLEKQRIEQELQVAKTIQKKLLPRDIAKIQGYDTWGVNHSSKEVGGDYFDIIPLKTNRIAFAIADVSGKSVPASLIMANLQAGLRMIIDEDLPLSTVVSKLNRLIYQNTDMDKYITFFIGILELKTNQFQYVNAGHNPPMYLAQSGKFHLLDEGGIILGMMPEYQYQTGNIKFRSGDLLLCYTDGVNEALNKDDEEFGEEKLQEIILKHKSKKAQQLAEIIVRDIKDFCEGVPQYDDITLLIAKRLD